MQRAQRQNDNPRLKAAFRRYLRSVDETLQAADAARISDSPLRSQELQAAAADTPLAVKASPKEVLYECDCSYTGGRFRHTVPGLQGLRRSLRL